MKTLIALVVASAALALPASAPAQSACIGDVKQARVIADFQTASLLCPKWNIVRRLDYIYMLMTQKVLDASALTKLERAGAVNLTEACQDEFDKIEGASFKFAEDIGLEKFCIRMAMWLTAPNLRAALEANGFIGLADGGTDAARALDKSSP